MLVTFIQEYSNSYRTYKQQGLTRMWFLIGKCCAFQILSPSPVLQKKIFQPIKTELSPTQSCISPAVFTPNPSTQDTQMSRSVLEEGSRASKGVESKPSDCKPLQTSLEKGECTISYYWGVPFCPMGQNPDEYTRVIMCQMEVYEKSLKEAQRELLHKADWGQPVSDMSCIHSVKTSNYNSYIQGHRN